MRVAVTVALLSFLCASAWAKAPARRHSRKDLPQHSAASGSPGAAPAWWNHFQASALLAVQPSGGNSVGPDVSWQPTLPLYGRFAARADLGVSLMSGATLGSVFVAPRYEGLLVFNGPGPLQLAVGLGAQTWVAAGGTSLIVPVSVAWKFDRKVLWVVDRAIAAYSACVFPNDLTHEVQLGIGVSL